MKRHYNSQHTFAYKWYKQRIRTTFAPGIKMWSNGIPIKTDTWQGCLNSCFVKDTLITMEDGSRKTIQDIKVGDRVLTINIDKNYDREPATVTETFKRESSDIYEIVVGDHYTLKLTGNHPVWTQRGWVEVKDLTLNDKMRWFRVESLENKRKASKRQLGANNSNWKGRIKKCCLKCGKDFFVPYARRLKAKFCSKSCLASYRMKKNNPMKIPSIVRKVARTLKEKWLKETHPNKGKKRPDVAKYMSSCANPMKNPLIAKKVRLKSFETLKKQGRISKGELLLEQYLKELDIPYKMNYPIRNKNKKGSRYYFLDVALPDSKINIEYDGHYRHYLAKGKKEDKKRDEFLKDLGWTVIRIKRNEIYDKELCLERIEKVLFSKLHNPGNIWARIKKIKKLNIKTTVYNIECPPNHNYLAFNYLVHNCRYCYADEFRASVLGRLGMVQNIQVARLLDLKETLRFFEGASSGKTDYKNPFMNWAIRNQYFIEVGTTGESFQDADEYFGVTYNFMKMCSDFGIPLFFNTKFNLPVYSEKYRKLLINHKAPIILCISLTTIDDELAKIYEPLSPLPSEILKTVKELTAYDHIKAITYISPFMPGVSDKDPIKFIETLIDCNMLSAHVRGFLMQGERFLSNFWKTYYKANEKDLEPFPGGFHVKYEPRKKFIETIQKRASELNPDFAVVGVKQHWFELPPYHGKMNYDVLPENFKKRFTDWMAIPIMRKIRQNVNTPQLLYWTKIGYKKDKINLPERVCSNEGAINTLMESLCNSNTSDVGYEMDGYYWLRGAMWNGWNEKEFERKSFFARLHYVFPVKDKGKWVRDNEGNYVLAFVPKKYLSLVRYDGQTLLLSPSSDKNLEEGYVEWKDAKTFMVPEREGGTEDKYYSREELKQLKEKVME